MIDFKGKKVVVLGAGDDTKDVIPYLEKEGALVTILDEKKGQSFYNLSTYDVIVRSPGVYRYRSEIEEAEKNGVIVTSKIKLFFDLCPAKIIGVTGTKGKGTTATLIYEILKKAGKKVYLGGNIGTGIFHLLPDLDKTSWVVLELSSFQLIDLEKSPHIGVVLMVTLDHQNWHISEEEYVTAKKNIVVYQKATNFAVVNKDYPNSVAIGKAAKGKVFWISGTDVTFSSRLRGEHNKENISAAIAVAKIIGVPFEETVANFKGLEHRLEEVRTVNGVTFYNDSFSTVPETAIAAIKAFHEPEIIILGGSEKGSDFTKLGKTIAQASNIKAVILIGLMTERIEKAIKNADPENKVKIIKGSKNMDEIVKTAYNNAISGNVVLLSPACASFDMFQSYKDRGQQFKDAVNLL